MQFLLEYEQECVDSEVAYHGRERFPKVLRSFSSHNISVNVLVTNLFMTSEGYFFGKTETLFRLKDRTSKIIAKQNLKTRR
jgi:hypothetical protein